MNSLDTENTLPKGCTFPKASLVKTLEALAPIRTDKALSEHLGISYNTWRKMMTGQPVRRSVLERLELRVKRIQSAR
jgi:hypothetical protein